MVLPDDDPEKWIYREHTAAKHEVYRKYIHPWVNKLTSYNEDADQYNKVRIVDCFAGKGAYNDIKDCEPLELEHIDSPVSIPGSPQVILDRLTDRSDQYAEAEAVFIEANESNYKELARTISETSGYSSDIKVNLQQGKFEDTVLDVVRTDGSDYPTLFFIDPFGFKSLDYEVVTEIGSTSQFEFLITFMYRDVNRFFEAESHKDPVKNVFGNDLVWEEVEGYESENWEDLVEYYADRLEEGGIGHTFEYLITEPDTKQTLYYLVFGTNHGNGLKTMREVMANCGTGKFGYAPKKAKHQSCQKSIMDFGDSQSLEEYLLNTYENHRIEFRTLVEECIKDRKYCDDVESDYRQSLRKLEKEDRVEVIRNCSNPDGTGIQHGDVIDFRHDPS